MMLSVGIDAAHWGGSHPASHMERNRATLQNQVSAHVILELCLFRDSAFPLLGTYVQYRSAPSCVLGVVSSVHGGNVRDSFTLGIALMAIHKEMDKKNLGIFFLHVFIGFRAMRS